MRWSVIPALLYLLSRLYVVLRGGGEGDHRGAPGTVALAVLVWFVAMTLGVPAIGDVLAGDLGRLPMVALLLALLFPWWLATRVTIPLGLVRVSWLLGRLSFWTWRGDTRGGGVVAAAWALVRARAPSGRTSTWTVARRDALRPLRGGGIVATALLAERRGDRETMLMLVRSTLLLAPAAAHLAARSLAAQWLAADAAARGDWREVVRVGKAIRRQPSGLRLLVAVGRVLVAPTHALGPGRRLGLWLTWLGAPRRIATLPLLRLALDPTPPPAGATPSVSDPQQGEQDEAIADAGDVAAAANGPHPPQDAAGTGPGPGGIAHAVALHAAVSQRPGAALTGPALSRLATSWAESLGSVTLARALVARAEQTGSRRGDALAAARESVTEELTELLGRAEVSRADLPEVPPILAAALARLETRRTAEVEARWRPLEQRVEEERDLPPIDEWREFLALRDAYEAAVAVRGDAARHVLFDDTDRYLSGLAVRLHNDREERALANAMFTWLLGEARRVDDPEAIDRLGRNAAHGV